MTDGFLIGGGECGSLIRSIDWSKNPLGPIEQWPQSLRTTLSIVINSKFPMLLLWGPEYICFYNDAYRKSLGNNGKHPQAMGQRGKECWHEIWDQIGERLNGVLQRGEATWDEDILLPIYRNGQLEEVYWTFSYSPVIDESGKYAGVFVAVVETTENIKALKDLNENKNELEFALNAAELGTWDLNPITRKFTCNNRLRRWFGLPGDQEIELNLALDSIVSKDRPKVMEAIQKALDHETGGHYTIQYTIKNAKTGKERIVKAKGKALFDANNVAYRLNGTLQDITDEVLALHAFRESEQNFRKLILQAPIGMIILKGEHFFVEEVNDAYLTLAGKERKDFVERPLWEALPEAKSLGFEHVLKKVMKSGVAHYGNEQHITSIKNGKKETTYINYVYEPLKDADGSINRIMVVAIDITDMLESKRKIQDAEERARLAADASGLGTFDLDLRTGKLATSARFDEIFGYDNPMPRSAYVNAIHPEDREIRVNAHRRALIVGNIYYEVRVLWKDNSIRWIRVEGKNYYDADQKPLRMLGTAMDITHQRQAKEELLQINQRLEIALEAGKLGSYELDIISRKIKLSEQFYKNFGLDPERQVTYDELLVMIDPLQKDSVVEAINAAILNGTLYESEYQIHWKDQSIHWIKESGKAIYNEFGNPVSFIGASFNITETKQLQQQKDDFIGIASHELKTPVTSIKAYGQVLERMLLKKGDVVEAGLMRKMDAQLNRLTSLIGDLLDVTKVNSGKLQYNYAYFDFNEMLLSAIEELQRTSEKHEIKQELEEIGLVFADRERISQVVTNFITNAIKYSPTANQVIVYAEAKGDNIVVCVEDFGIGIAEDNLNKVFEQFYRVGGTMQHTFPGLGLGLYISSEIIKREGGKIWVSSKEGKGSKFCFSIPRSRVNDF